MNSRRWYVLIALLVLVAIMLAGCGNKAAPASQTGGGRAGSKDLRLVVRKFPDPKAPYYRLSVADPLMYALLYDYLLVNDSAKGLQPGLASEWNLSDDKLIITFKLNPNAKFHNGEPVLAGDVIFTFSLLRGGGVAPQMQEYFACVDKLEEAGEREVKLTLKQECPNALSGIATKILIINKSSWLNPGAHTVMQPDEKLLSGTGAFSRDKNATVQGKKLVLRATGKHLWLKPIVDTVTFEVVEDENVAESSVKIADVWPLIFGQ